MSRGFPSTTALLGLLAVAGYQNRHKIAKWLGGAGQQHPTGGGYRPHDREGGLTGILRQLAQNLGGQNLGGQKLGGTTPGGILSGPPARLTDRSRQSGPADTANSWVGRRPNRAMAPSELERAIGPDVLDNLSRQTGLSRQELLTRLSRELPDVDKNTP